VTDRYEMSVEILDGDSSAEIWRTSYGDVLTSTAVEHGVLEWRWLHRTWGVVFEIAFSDEDTYDAWRDVAAVRSAFDAVPDPVRGLVFHRGWGGTTGFAQPRRPRPLAGAGAAELTFDDVLDRVTDAIAGDARRTLIADDDPAGAAASI
jgi:hypothetical protein